jgi:hypothetical protein
VNSEDQPDAVDDGALADQRADAVDDGAVAEDEPVRIEAALARLTEPAAGPHRPLADLAAGLDDLHQELQAALAGLDRS